MKKLHLRISRLLITTEQAYNKLSAGLEFEASAY